MKKERKRKKERKEGRKEGRKEERERKEEERKRKKEKKEGRKKERWLYCKYWLILIGCWVVKSKICRTGHKEEQVGNIWAGVEVSVHR